MSALLTPELLRRLEQFQLLAARRAKSSAKGERRSKARGQSVEFADYRNYVAGDDLRYLDWNLFGRLERLFLKLYEEERELPVRIFLDCSESMTFGEPRKFDFAPKSHIDLAEELDLVDFDAGARIAGSRSYFLKGVGAELHQAILRFALDMMVYENGFVPMTVPVLVREAAMPYQGARYEY